MLLLLCLAINVSLFAQKVQVKKGKILVDKVEKYTIIQTQEGKMVGALWPHYDIVDNEGNLFLRVGDTTFNYAQLPYEKVPREVTRAHTVYSPELDREFLAPRPGGPYPNYIKYYLDKAGFFTDMVLTPEIFDRFIELAKQDEVLNQIAHIPETDSIRMNNYRVMSEKFGEPEPRRIGYVQAYQRKIYDGNRTVTEPVGEFEIVNTRNPGKHFKVANAEGIIVGNLHLSMVNRTMEFHPYVQGVEPIILRYSAQEWINLMKEEAYLTVVAQRMVLEGFI